MVQGAFRRGLALVVTALAVVLAGPVTSAHAASGDYGRINSRTEHRDCPDVRCATQRYIESRTQVQVWCWRDAGSAYGTNRWFRVRAGGADAWVSANRVDRQPSVPYCSDIRAGETLFADHSVWSPNGAYRLVMQSDNNLVLYGPHGAKWSTRTCCSRGARMVMQPDGNWVVYDSSNAPIWHAGTFGNPGVRIEVQSDGNVVAYLGSRPLYAASWHWARGQTRGHNGASDSGQCTWYANERFRQHNGSYLHVSGDAHNWNDSAGSRGWLVSSDPMTHAVVVFERSGSSPYGHVAWVDALQIRGDGAWIHIVEMNRVGWGRISDRWLKHGAGMSYIPAQAL